MSIKFKLAIIIIFGIYFFTGCKNDSTTATAKVPSKILERIKSDTIVNKLNLDKTKSDDSLFIAMNKMLTKIKDMKLSRNVDIDFANIIIQHHQGAIDMSLIEIKSGSDAGIKAMAKKIIRNQMDEQSNFGNIVQGTKPMKMNMRRDNELFEDISEMKAAINTIKLSGNIDKDFVNLMIEHHESEIKISKNEFSNGLNSQLKQMSQKLINDQTKEINEFKNWLLLSSK